MTFCPLQGATVTVTAVVVTEWLRKRILFLYPVWIHRSPRKRFVSISERLVLLKYVCSSIFIWSSNLQFDNVISNERPSMFEIKIRSKNSDEIKSHLNTQQKLNVCSKTNARASRKFGCTRTKTRESRRARRRSRMMIKTPRARPSVGLTAKTSRAAQ